MLSWIGSFFGSLFGSRNRGVTNSPKQRISAGRGANVDASTTNVVIGDGQHMPPVLEERLRRLADQVEDQGMQAGDRRAHSQPSYLSMNDQAFQSKADDRKTKLEPKEVTEPKKEVRSAGRLRSGIKAG